MIIIARNILIDLDDDLTYMYVLFSSAQVGFVSKMGIIFQLQVMMTR
jgi:hypothetical protein